MLVYIVVSTAFLERNLRSLPQITRVTLWSRLPYVHRLSLWLLSKLSMLEVKGGSYRHPPAHRRHVSRVHLTHGYAHLPRAHVLIHRMLSDQGLSRLLLVLQCLKSLLLHLLLQCRVIRGV